MSKKLLLADDSITIQKVIGITFANEDYELCVVDNGDAALEKARSFAPDLILADVFMPGKNGYELCSAVKTDAVLKHIPLLLLTGTFEPFDEGKAKAAGADSWIAKPFESQALIDRVEELLSRGVTAAAPAAGQAVIDSEEDLGPAEEAEGGMWGDPPEEPALADDITAREEKWQSADAAADDDIWGGDIALEKEPAPEIVPAPQESAEFEMVTDPWGELDEEISVGSAAAAYLPRQQVVHAGERTPAAASAAAAEDAVESDWDEFGEDILSLDECDILEEENLPDENEAATANALEDSFIESEDVLLGKEEVWDGAPQEVSAADMPAWEEDNAEAKFADPAWENLQGDEDLADSLDTSAPAWEVAEEESAEEAAAASAWAKLEEEAVVPAAAPAAPAPPAAPAFSPAAIEAQVASLTEEDIARVVEKVAGKVIERLASAVLEKIVWEVVPDLAEAMIREEIRLIKEDVQ